jgi:hypothetical protein
MIITLDKDVLLNKKILDKIGNAERNNVLGVKDILECQLALMDTECDLLIINTDYEEKTDVLCKWIIKNNPFIKRIILFAKSKKSDANVKTLKSGQYKVDVMDKKMFREGLEKL